MNILGIESTAHTFGVGIVTNNGQILANVKDMYKTTSGGMIPLEGLRLGFDVYSGDYNPVAVLIQKCILEYPQKFFSKKSPFEGLHKDVEKWSSWVFDQAKNDLSEVFHSKISNFDLAGYIWTKILKCFRPFSSFKPPRET